MSNSASPVRCSTGAVVVAFAATPILAQGVTAQVSGVVVDATDSVVPGVTVTITNADTNWSRELVTEVGGRFLFVDVLAGTYVVSAAREGFRTVERTDVAVGSTDRVELPALVLNAGGVYDTITVTGEADLVQTTTGARSARITRDHLDDIALKGRDSPAC